MRRLSVFVLAICIAIAPAAADDLMLLVGSNGTPYVAPTCTTPAAKFCLAANSMYVAAIFH